MPYNFTTQRFASRLEFNTNARYMAVLYLKNGIERNWRRGTSSSISDQDKADIRTALKELILVEPTLPIAIHLAVTIGKIVSKKSLYQFLRFVVSLKYALKFVIFSG